MSAAIRNYKHKDFTYLLNELNGITSDNTAGAVPTVDETPPECQNIAGLDSASYAKLKECCKNKKSRYNSMIFLLSRASFNDEYLTSFLELSPKIRSVGYDGFSFDVGANEWKINMTDERTADLIIRYSKITADGRKHYTCEKLFYSGSFNDILLMLYYGIPDQHCCKVSEELLLRKSNKKQNSARSALLNDAHIWYIRDSRNDIVHEKSCSCICDIPDEAITGMKRISPETKLCKWCCKASLIRTVIGESSRYLNAYTKFFEKISIDNHQLRALIFDNKTTLSFPSPDTNLLSAKVNDDNWLLERNPDNTLTLWHNDYQMTKGDVRYFTGGYHVQLPKATGKMAIATMCSYSWADHVARRKASVQAAPVHNDTAVETKLTERKTSKFMDFVQGVFHAVRGLFQKKRK